MTIKLPANRIARYDIAEIFDLINSDKVQTEEDAIIVLQAYKTPELEWYLQVMYSDDVKWKFGDNLPRWKPSTFERGNTFSTAQHQLPRLRGLIVGTRPDMNEAKAREIFLNVMEVIYKDEAKWIGYLVRKSAERKIKFMSRELINRAFPGMLCPKA